MSKGPEILNLNELIPNKRIVKLVDKEIDVTKIPAKVSLKILKNFDKLEEDNDESLDLVFDIVMDIIKPQNPDITLDWIMDNTDLIQLVAFIKFIIEPVQKMIAEEADIKNVLEALEK